MQSELMTIEFGRVEVFLIRLDKGSSRDPEYFVLSSINRVNNISPGSLYCTIVPFCLLVQSGSLHWIDMAQVTYSDLLDQNSDILQGRPMRHSDQRLPCI